MENDTTASSDKLNLYVTGFGKFANILVNPTSILVNNLIEMQSKSELNIEGACF